VGSVSKHNWINSKTPGASAEGRKVVAAFDGGAITSDAAAFTARDRPLSGPLRRQIRTASRHTLSALANSSASAKALIAEELSPIQSLGAAIQCEICASAN
jgi:hypothetical protein